MLTKEALIAQTFFKVVDKQGAEIPFRLNNLQLRLDEQLTGRDIIPKGRQFGVSTYFLSRYTAACLSNPNERCVIISHDTPSTQRLLNRCKFFLDSMDPGPVIENMSANEITFPKTGSMLFIGTAGSRKFGRGDTITRLHCSEYAYWPNKPEELLSGLMDAVPMSGEVAIESTGNGMGNDYYNRCVRAFEGKSTFRCHFLSWLDFEEYQVPLTEEEKETVRLSLRVDLDEPALHQAGVTLEQIIWRRMKLEQKNYDLRLFRREYPVDFAEAFQASGNSIFYRVNYKPTTAWSAQGDHTYVLNGHPRAGHRYSLGCDPAGGVGGDNATIEIFDIGGREGSALYPPEQVAEYANDRIDPDALGHKVADLARWFNDAFVTVESNNHGPVTLNALRELYPSQLIYSPNVGGNAAFEDRTLMRMGFRTTSRTKPIIVGKLRTALASDVIIHSPILKGELDTFIEHEDGTLGAQDGSKDDRVLGSAMAVFGMENAGMYAGDGREVIVQTSEWKDPFALDTILGQIQKSGGNGLPIKSHTRTEGTD